MQLFMDNSAHGVLRNAKHNAERRELQYLYRMHYRGRNDQDRFPEP